MLVCGDIHGNFEKLSKFLNYKKRKKHLLVGDYVDDFEPRTDEEIIDCLQSAINSNATLLWGNHEVHYLKNPPFLCSGFRDSLKDKIQEILSKNLDRFLIAYCEDQYLITHAGVHKDYPFNGNQQEYSDHLNKEMRNFIIESQLNGNKQEIKPLFYISKYREGDRAFGGPLFMDFLSEELKDDFPQIIGHTPLVGVDFKKCLYKKHVNVDLPGYNLCFNTKTRKFESFG